MSSSPLSSAHLELVFPCAHCHGKLQVEVVHHSQRARKCKHCSEPTQAPELNERIAGFDELLDLVDFEGDFSCPACRRSITLSVHDLQQSQSCPGCHTQLFFRLVPAAAEVVNSTGKRLQPPPVPLPLGQLNSQGQPAPNSTSLTPPSQYYDDFVSTPPPPSPQELGSPGHPPGSSGTPPPPTLLSYPGDGQPPENQDQDSYYTDDYDSFSQSWRLPSFNRFVPLHLVYKTLVWGIILSPIWLFFLGLFGQSGGVAFLGLLLFFFGFPVIWVGVRLVAPLLSLFVSRIHCPHCREEYPAMNYWVCSCGFKDYQKRHVLRFKCPICKKRMGRTTCLRCDCTIRIIQ